MIWRSIAPKAVFVGVVAGVGVGGYFLGVGRAPVQPESTSTERNGESCPGDAAEAALARLERQQRLLVQAIDRLAAGAPEAEAADNVATEATVEPTAEAPELEPSTDPDTLLATQQLVDRVLAKGQLTEADATEFRQLTEQMQVEDVKPLLGAIFGAANNGELEMEPNLVL